MLIGTKTTQARVYARKFLHFYTINNCFSYRCVKTYGQKLVPVLNHVKFSTPQKGSAK
jgi:hypothetical protein